jgi:hypothetical protein
MLCLYIRIKRDEIFVVVIQVRLLSGVGSCFVGSYYKRHQICSAVSFQTFFFKRNVIQTSKNMLAGKNHQKKNWLQRSRTSQRLFFNLISFDREYLYSFFNQGTINITRLCNLRCYKSWFSLPTNEDIKSTWTVIHQNVFLLYIINLQIIIKEKRSAGLMSTSIAFS